jgi:CspA family cold shock protein
MADKGFGFLRPDNGQQDRFFHRSGCTDPFETLEEGTRVTFEEEPSPKGPRATNVARL